jgi:hypothetical protein
MAAPISPIDAEIAQQKQVLQRLQVQVRTTIATYSNMPPKDRARNISEIQKTMENLARFFDKLKTSNIQNTGTRFTADNLKQSYLSLRAQWRKFELSLNSARAG